MEAFFCRAQPPRAGSREGAAAAGPALAGNVTRMLRLAKNIVILLVVGVLALALGPRVGEAREVQLIMALDISGSMKTTDPLRLLPKAAQIMVELLDEKDSLGILTFEDVTLTRLPRGPLTPAQRRKGFQELFRLQPQGLWTDIHQVTAEALKAFGPQEQTKRALLLITDGQMDIDPLKGNSKAFVERLHQEIIPAYKKAGIPIYTVAFTEASDQALLKTLAEQTGGRFLLIPKADEVHQAFTKFYEDLKGPQVAPLVGNQFLIDSQVQEAILVATRASQGKPVVMSTPKGQKLGPASKGIRWFSAPTFDMVTLPKPEPGNWTVSGHKEGDGRVILLTDLKLECPHLPEEAGADEALITGALLVNKGQAVTLPEVTNQTVFTAELQAEGGKPVQLPLGNPPADQKELWPAGTRLARFPAFGAPGVWNLKIKALGKTFQRERNISLKVTHPWYKGQAGTGEPGQVEFKPSPDRKASQLAGWINISDPAGGIAGKFVQPQPGSSIRFAMPPNLSGACWVGLELTGVTASGRPLFLRPAALQVNLSPTAASAAGGSTSAAAAAAPGAKNQAAAAEIGPKGQAAASSPGSTGFLSRHRKLLLAAGLGLVAVMMVLLTIAYLFRPPALRFLIIGGRGGDVITDDMPMEKQNLLLKAQVESLQKEKNKLLADIGEMREQIEKLTSAKEELEAKLGEPSQEYKEKSKIIKELEQRLEEAEKEAKSVQEEYMALYARSQKEKQVMKKG